MSKNDGGPAFPLVAKAIGYHADIQQLSEGLSLRDYFAAAALPRVLDLLARATAVSQKVDPEATKKAALISYEIADAMIEQRQK